MRALDGSEYMPGLVGLNNMSCNDYVNVIIQVCRRGPCLSCEATITTVTPADCQDWQARIQLQRFMRLRGGRKCSWAPAGVVSGIAIAELQQLQVSAGAALWRSAAQGLES